jgi:glycosyltransferase involved in cell wall biosynthesis
LKILFFAPARSVHTHRWLSAIAGFGHDVHLAAAEEDLGIPLPGVTYHRLKAPGWIPFPLDSFFRLREAREVLQRVNPDIIHGHYISSSGGYPAHLGRHPFVLTAWGSDILLVPHRSPFHRALISWRLKRCDLLTADADHVLKAAVCLGGPADRSTIVQWGTDVEEMHRLRLNPRLHELAGIPEGAVTVLSVRWLESVYNIDTVVRAIPAVAAGSKVPVVFVFAGDGGERDRLGRLAADLGVANRTRFLGRLDPAEVKMLFGGADVYVSVPDSDGTSVSLLEAMATGLPSIVSDVPANREWIENGENGFVVPRRDPAALASAILKLVGDPALRKAFGERVVKVAAHRADHVTNMRQMESLYRSLLVARAPA